jgi:hypothetical protein
MSKEHPERSKPLPHCKALLLCEKVTESQLTGKTTLHNLVRQFALPRFPGRSTPFTIFLELYDGTGRYSVRLQFNSLVDDSTIAETSVDDLDFLGRLAKIQVTVPVEYVRLSQPGRYELVVFLDEQPLASQYFDAELGDGGA